MSSLVILSHKEKTDFVKLQEESCKTAYLGLLMLLQGLPRMAGSNCSLPRSFFRIEFSVNNLDEYSNICFPTTRKYGCILFDIKAVGFPSTTFSTAMQSPCVPFWAILNCPWETWGKLNLCKNADRCSC